MLLRIRLRRRGTTILPGVRKAVGAAARRGIRAHECRVWQRHDGFRGGAQRHLVRRKGSDPYRRISSVRTDTPGDRCAGERCGRRGSRAGAPAGAPDRGEVLRARFPNAAAHAARHFYAQDGRRLRNARAGRDQRMHEHARRADAAEMPRQPRQIVTIEIIQQGQAIARWKRRPEAAGSSAGKIGQQARSDPWTGASKLRSVSWRSATCRCEAILRRNSMFAPMPGPRSST